jgi:hypothetical protein
MNPPEDPLDELLATWQVEASAPSDFQRQVWHRIAADQEDLPWTACLLSWWLQPRRLFLSAAASLALGALVGVIDAGWHQKQAREAYFSAINPLDGHHKHTFAFTAP